MNNVNKFDTFRNGGEIINHRHFSYDNIALNHLRQISMSLMLGSDA